jgi:glutamyl-Q tRNA(Asp) synthetase
LPTPSHLHTPLVRGRDGEKLSKQNGARAVDLSDPAAAIRAAARALDLPLSSLSGGVQPTLDALVPAWATRYGLGDTKRSIR